MSEQAVEAAATVRHAIWTERAGYAKYTVFRVKDGENVLLGTLVPSVSQGWAAYDVDGTRLPISGLEGYNITQPLPPVTAVARTMVTWPRY